MAEIEAEIPYPLSQVVRDIEQALQRKASTTGCREARRPATTVAGRRAVNPYWTRDLAW